MTIIEWMQHPVGHGGFHTGVMRADGAPPFTWIFDCGARKTRKFDDYLRGWLIANARPVDWLFISHFDTDHVSGLETLMSRAPVVDVMVPYVNEHELAVILLHEVARDTLTRPLVELSADPAAFFLSRGAERVTFLDGGRREGGEPGEEPPRRPTEPDGWKTSINPPPRDLKAPGWSMAGAQGEAAVRVVEGDCDIGIVRGAEGLRLKPYRAPLKVGAHDALIAALEALTNTKVGSSGRPGLYGLAYAVANHARTPAGRAALRGLYKVFAGSSNRSSLSLLSIPQVAQEGSGNWSVRRSSWSWRCGTGEAAWVNTGDAELRNAKDLDDWEDWYVLDLEKVQVAALPHHGSDHNSDSAFQDLCPNATLTAHVNPRSKKHPGADVALSAAGRLHPVTDDRSTTLHMSFRSR